MPVEYHDPLSLLFRKYLKPLEQVELFAREKLLIESADLSKCSSLTEDKRTSRPLFNPAHEIPCTNKQSGHDIGSLDLDRASTR